MRDTAARNENRAHSSQEEEEEESSDQRTRSRAPRSRAESNDEPASYYAKRLDDRHGDARHRALPRPPQLPRPRYYDLGHAAPDKMRPLDVLALCATEELSAMHKGGARNRVALDNKENRTEERSKGRKSIPLDLEDELNIDFPSVTVDDRKLYKCTYSGCGKVFPSLSRIRRHYIIHTGAKPFKCLNPQCKKSFSRRDNMIQHYKGHCNYTRQFQSVQEDVR